MTENMTVQALREHRQGQRPKRRDHEGPIHRAVLSYLQMALPNDAVLHHSPNELDMAGSEAARQVAKARKMGTRRGWPDFEIMWRGRAYFMEIKAPGGRIRDDQSCVMRDLRAAGAHYEVVHSVEEACEAIRVWGMR